MKSMCLVMSDSGASVKIKVIENTNLPLSVLLGMRTGSENLDTRQNNEVGVEKKIPTSPNKYFDRSKHQCRMWSIRLKIIHSRDSVVMPKI